MDKWLKNKALNVLMELTNNTEHGAKALQEFAEYTGSKDSEDVLFKIFKGVANHVEFCSAYPEEAEVVNDMKIYLR
tara:strand:+ start:554 stop:781 length:228 start_codon:yes stop_codon:yes gene_type:complete